MATVDLIQLRWQQIRAFEHTLIVEKENITLRKEVNELRAQREIDLAEKNRALDIISKLSQAKVNELAKLMSVVKLEVNTELSEYTIFIDQMKIATEKLLELLRNTRNDLKKSRDETSATKKQLDDLRTTAAQSNRSKTLEVERLRSKVEKLNSDLNDSEKSRNNLTTEYMVLKTRLEDLSKSKSGLELRVDVSL